MPRDCKPNVRRSARSAALAVIVGLTASAAAASDRGADIAALTEAKLNAWPAYYRNSDGDGLSAFLADGFVHIDGDGRMETKAEAVAWVRANRWDNANNGFRYEIRDIAFYSDDIANVYGTGSYNGAGADRCRMIYMSANIFVRQQGRWRPMFSQTSNPACAGGQAESGG